MQIKKTSTNRWRVQKYSKELHPKKNSKIKNAAKWFCTFAIPPYGLARLISAGLRRLVGMAIFPAQFQKEPNGEAKAFLKECGYENHTLITPDNVRLDAMYYKSTEQNHEARTVVLFNGNATRYEDLPALGEHFQQLNWNVLLFNPRHVGESQAKWASSARDTILDAETAYQFAKAQGVNKENILLWGHSLGGAIATAVAAQHKKVMLVNDRSFSSLSQEIKLLIGKLTAKLAVFLGWEYDSVANFNKVQGKKVVILHPEDQVIKRGARLGEKISQNLIELKKTVEDAHNDEHSAAFVTTVVRRYFFPPTPQETRTENLIRKLFGL